MTPYKLREWIDEDMLDWNRICLNPNAIDLLSVNLSKINWEYLIYNPNAMPILEANLDKVDWTKLPNKWRMLEFRHTIENKRIRDAMSLPLEDFVWVFQSIDPNKIELLRDNLDKIDWSQFSANPAIFTYDYFKMKMKKHRLHEELINALYHPDRVVPYWNIHRSLNGYLGYVY